MFNTKTIEIRIIINFAYFESFLCSFSFISGIFLKIFLFDYITFNAIIESKLMVYGGLYELHTKFKPIQFNDVS